MGVSIGSFFSCHISDACILTTQSVALRRARCNGVGVRAQHSARQPRRHSTGPASEMMCEIAAKSPSAPESPSPRRRWACSAVRDQASGAPWWDSGSCCCCFIGMPGMPGMPGMGGRGGCCSGGGCVIGLGGKISTSAGPSGGEKRPSASACAACWAAPRLGGRWSKKSSSSGAAGCGGASVAV